MKLIAATPDARVVEIGDKKKVSGRFEYLDGVAGQQRLGFVSDDGSTFIVANMGMG